MKQRIGVLLCGCGSLDGTDPSEALLTILEIQAVGHEPVLLAIDTPQLHVVDHLSGFESENESRNQMQESARIYRGKVYPLQEISPKVLDGVVIPGGQGIPKNLLGAFGGGANSQLESIAEFLRAVQASGGFLAALSLGEFLLSHAVGPFPDGRGAMELAPEEIHAEEERRVFFSPGVLTAADLPQLQAGIRNLIRAAVRA